MSHVGRLLSLVAVVSWLVACASTDTVSAPKQPTNVMVAAGPGTIIVTWTDVSTNESGFRVFRETIQSSLVVAQAFTVVGSTGADVTEFVDKSVEAGVAYRYAVSAFNDAGESTPTGQAGGPLERGSLIFALNVIRSGSGSGSVNSVPAGIMCGSDCYETYEQGTSLMLTAAAAGGSQFAGWSGACSGTAVVCTVDVVSNLEVVATFVPIEVPPEHGLISVMKAGNGSGLVSSDPTGIYCASDCSETYAKGSIVTLSANEAADSVFVGWSGGVCEGTGACVVTVTGSHAVTATFSLKKFTLAVSLDGAGLVGSSPSGIACEADCSEVFDAGTVVTLSATPGAEQVFQGWEGACAGTATSCQIEMTADMAVTARFRGTYILVTSTYAGVGGPDCTLRDAIKAANTDARSGGCQAGNGSDTIRLPGDQTFTLLTVDNTADGPNGMPSITTPITIQGNGATIERSLDADPFRLFHVGATGQLTIEDATLRWGHGGGYGGGGIYVDGGRAVLLRNILRENLVSGSEQPAKGAAILNNGGDVVVRSSTLTSNGWNPSTSGYSDGTVAVVDGTLTLTDSSIVGSEVVEVALLVEGSTSSTTIVSSVIADNFSIAIRNYGLMYLTDVRIANNYLSLDRAGMTNYGSMYFDRVTYERHQSEGGGSLGNVGYLYIANSIIRFNYGDWGGGGGINNSGVLEIVDSLITGNTTRTGSGGGIYSSGKLTIRGGVVDSNYASKGGGLYSSGTLDLHDAGFAGNTTGLDGGALYVTGRTNLWGSTEIGGKYGNNGSNRNGGGVYVQGATLSVCETCRISANDANYQGETQGVGGGIYAVDAQLIGVSPQTVYGNTPNQVVEVNSGP